MLSVAKVNPKVAVNIRAHDRVAKNYERLHGEIYNPIEQDRLRLALREAIRCIDTRSASKLALDFGCGAGNLTRHLSELGCNVVAADVSRNCLDLVISKSYSTQVAQLLLNGTSLSNVESSSVDIIATYSVLHHVPDYLAILPEFLRVLKPGGVIFIDHELAEEYWSPSPNYLKFLKEIAPAPEQRWRKYFRIQSYVNWAMCKFVDPRYRPEGDIHVFVDDHIEWTRISEVLLRHGAEIVKQEQYLLFKRGYDLDVYKRYSSEISDMQFLIARKLG